MYWEIFIDGASRGQGKQKFGDAACAALIYRNKKEHAKYARPLGKRTNNEAEYEALITALLMCASDPAIKDPIIYSDSAVVCNQVNETWACRNEGLLPLLVAVQIIKQEYRFRLKQVERSYVAAADGMCQATLDLFESKRAEILKQNRDNF